MSGGSKCPHVFRAISRITAAFAKAGIAKGRTNLQDQYQYRSIDDVLNRLAPLLAKHGLCVLPRVLRREAEDRTGEAGSILVNVRLLVAFDLISSRDGSRYSVRAWGEALDAGDKGTAKAMSAAYKSAMLQTFCVPVAGEDADASAHRLKAKAHEREPVQGWSAWTDDIQDMIGVCESAEALERVRTRQAALLEALRRERPELYAGIGKGFSARAQELSVQDDKGSKEVRQSKGSGGEASPQAQGQKTQAAAAQNDAVTDARVRSSATAAGSPGANPSTAHLEKISA